MMRLTSRGETIVEVLVVTVILTFIMASSFAVTTHTLNQNRASQERTEAAGYAQNQIERLVSATSTGLIKETNLPATYFCMVDPNPAAPSPISYKIVATPNSLPSECTSGRYGGYIRYDAAHRVYIEKVVWDNATGSGQDNIELNYRSEYTASSGSTTGPVAPGPGPIVPPDPCPSSGIPNGKVQACYYNDTAASGPFSTFAVNQTENPGGNFAVNNNWGLGSPAGVNADNFSARYNGNFNFAAGTYRFTLGGDDGVRLYVDGAAVPVIDKWSDQSYTQFTADVTLTAGFHAIKMEYYERGGFAQNLLSWAPLSVLEVESFGLNGGVFSAADGAASGGAVAVFPTFSAVAKTVNVPAFGTVTVRAKGDQYAGAPLMTLIIDGNKVFQDTQVPNTGYATFPYTIVPKAAGSHTFTISFNNDACEPVCGTGQDRNLYVDSITLSP